MPDALEQAQRQYALAAKVAAWATAQPGANARLLQAIANDAQTGQVRCGHVMN